MRFDIYIIMLYILQVNIDFDLKNKLLLKTYFSKKPIDEKWILMIMKKQKSWWMKKKNQEPKLIIFKDKVLIIFSWLHHYYYR